MNRRSFLTMATLGSVAHTLSIGSHAEANEICKISEPILRSVESQLGAACEVLEPYQLAQITNLKLTHIHIPGFLESDFYDLANLKSLTFQSLFHKPYLNKDVKAMTRAAFSPLSNIESLYVDDDLGTLDDDVFAELTSLKILKLRGLTKLFEVMPKSLLGLSNLQEFYIRSKDFTAEELDQLKLTYGSVLKVSA